MWMAFHRPACYYEVLLSGIVPQRRSRRDCLYWIEKTDYFSNSSQRWFESFSGSLEADSTRPGEEKRLHFLAYSTASYTAVLAWRCDTRQALFVLLIILRCRASGFMFPYCGVHMTDNLDNQASNSGVMFKPQVTDPITNHRVSGVSRIRKHNNLGMWELFSPAEMPTIRAGQIGFKYLNWAACTHATPATSIR